MRLSTRAKQVPESDNSMSPQIQAKDSEEMRSEYDFSQGVRGKHHKSFQAGINVVFLEPDIAAVFQDSASVNRALRFMFQIRLVGDTGRQREISREVIIALTNRGILRNLGRVASS
jgi:hypothetical protein